MSWLDDALARGTVTPPNIGTRTLEPKPFWRVYDRQFAAKGFNPSDKGNARFSPLVLSDGSIVPTMYVGSSVDVALMEVVLRNAPVAPQSSAGYILGIQTSTENRRVACLEPTAPLLLADLGTLGLRRLGISRSDAIDCDKTGYPTTRLLAAWLYDHDPDIQGICWTSRQLDEGLAAVLFEPRMGTTGLIENRKDEPFTVGPHKDALVLLADRMGAMVNFTP